MSTPSNIKQQNKQERRDAAREQARKLREAQQRREKRNRLFIIGGVIAFVAIVAVALVSILSQSGGPSLDGAERPSTATEAGAIPVGADGAAGTVNEDAPVVDVYYDYQCPHCATFEQTNAELLVELASSGDATIEYHPISILDNSGNNTGFSTRGAQAAAVVADQAPELFVDFNTALFDAQGPAGGVALSDDQIAQAAESVGVPQDVIDSFGGSTFRDWVRGATTQAAEDGVQATPTIHIDGEPWQGNWQEPGALEQAVADAA
ncbi:DsbA family protein [Georgenia wangjunii]|uniref:DsbA family protein n=1 Tax=Georgenia wangjunii TaxID=3117730 RepID=UPI002F25F405